LIANIHLLGIGWVIAQYLLSAPQANNVIVLARTQEPLQKLKEQYPKQVEVITGDVTDFTLGEKAVKLAVSTFGRLDGLVLNHGVLGQVGKIADADPKQWKQGFDINFISLVAFVSSHCCIYKLIY
jgi:NADP-dependent 3-hydroxy acid dehydrogenase YdfG